MKSEGCQQEIHELSQHYLERTYPYELMTEGIALQNQEIEQLEHKLASLGDVPELTEDEKKTLKKWKSDSTHLGREEHRKWTEQSMMQLKPRFDKAQEKKLKELDEQIRLKSGTFNNRLHGINIVSSLENSLDSLRFVIEQAPRNELKNLRHLMKLHQQVLVRVESFDEVAELDSLLSRLQEKERNAD